jgi:mercuric ion binding protein
MNTFIRFGFLIGFACAMATPVLAGEEKVMIMLGGRYCDAYLGNVQDALTKVAGVKAVDMKSMKGHAVVTVESGKVKPDQLVTAVNGVKGDSWYCTGEVMK